MRWPLTPRHGGLFACLAPEYPQRGLRRSSTRRRGTSVEAGSVSRDPEPAVGSGRTPRTAVEDADRVIRRRTIGTAM